MTKPMKTFKEIVEHWDEQIGGNYITNGRFNQKTNFLQNLLIVI